MTIIGLLVSAVQTCSVSVVLLLHSFEFQVFGTDVMVTVAKSFEAPIKCEYLHVQIIL